MPTLLRIDGDAGARRGGRTMLGRGVIVLDDPHRLVDPVVMAWLAQLAEWLPGNWTLVIAGPTDPAPSISTLRACGEFGELQPTDPQFTAPAKAAPSGLSRREVEVLERIAAGDSNKLIARALDLSPHTVKRHVANILDKLALNTRGQAASWFHARSALVPAMAHHDRPNGSFGRSRKTALASTCEQQAGTTGRVETTGGCPCHSSARCPLPSQRSPSLAHRPSLATIPQ